MNTEDDIGAPPPLRIGLPSRLGEMLIREGLVSSDDVQKALAEQAAGSEWRLGRLLVRQGALDDRALIGAIARQFHVPVADLRLDPPVRTALARIPRDAAFQLQALAIRVDGPHLVVAVADPPTRDLRVAVERSAGMAVRLVLCPADELAAALDHWYGDDVDVHEPDPAVPSFDDPFPPPAAHVAAPAPGPVPRAYAPDPVPTYEFVTPGPEPFEPGSAAGPGPAGEPADLQIVVWLLTEALRQQASAVHLDHGEDGLRVRYRVDGGVVLGPTLPRASGTAVCHRLLAAAQLDPAGDPVHEGAFTVVVEGRPLTCRVVAASTPSGTHVVVRTGPGDAARRLEDLRMAPADVAALRRILDDARGVVVVTAAAPAMRAQLVHAVIDEIGPDDHVVVGVPHPGGIAMPRGVVHAPAPGARPGDAVRVAGVLGADTLVVDGDDAETVQAAFDAASELLVVVAADGDDPSRVATSLVDVVGGFLVAGMLRAVLTGSEDAGVTTAEVHLVTDEVCRAILDLGPQG
ncbi:MAG: ATPase, T2SS/T4P/T4SS family [Acidimicrobiia bacterium]|jgi:hypothetical protein